MFENFRIEEKMDATGNNGRIIGTEKDVIAGEIKLTFIGNNDDLYHFIAINQINENRICLKQAPLGPIRVS